MWLCKKYKDPSFHQMNNGLGRCILLSISLFLIYSFSLNQNEGTNEEYKLKTAFIFNFTKYVEWDSITNNDFVICVFGESPIIETLDNDAANNKIKNKKVVVKRCNSTDQASMYN